VGTAGRERGNDNRPASPGRGHDDIAQLIFSAFPVLVPVKPIPLCGFQDQVISGFDCRRVENNRLIIAANIPGE